MALTFSLFDVNIAIWPNDIRPIDFWPNGVVSVNLTLHTFFEESKIMSRLFFAESQVHYFQVTVLEHGFDLGTML
jgi:hypothetical protein